MTTVELSDLIQQQMTENPVLEEVSNQDEVHEISAEMLDQTAGADLPESFDQLPAVSSPESEMNGFSANGDADFGAPEDRLMAPPEAPGPAEEAEPEERARDSFEEIDFGREFQDYLDPGYRTQEFEYNPDAPTFEQFLTRPPSLADHLAWQLHMSPVDSVLCDVAESVIGNLDSDGRLHA
ncbi:MAG: hypothetical protein WKF30_07540, partial [Pyrinomonadaceae bacterium]